MDVSETLKDLVNNAIANDLKIESGEDLKWSLIYDDDRKIYRISLPDEARFYILKIRGKDAVKENDLDDMSIQGEFDKLKLAWNAVGNLPKELSMSRPIEIWLEHKAILLSGCLGVNMNTHFNENLIKYSLSTQTLKNQIKLAGRWLSQYHLHAGDQSAAQEHASRRLGHTLRMLERIENNNNTELNSNEFKQLSTIFSSTLSKIEAGFVGQIHGNFAFRNILIGNDFINLIDFEDAREDLLAYDFGQFAAEIWLKSYVPWLSFSVKGLIGSFTKEYAQKIDFEPKALEIMTAYHLLVHLYEFSCRKKVKGIRGWILKYRMTHLTKILKKWIENPKKNSLI